jgi:hypothetical protein
MLGIILTPVHVQAAERSIGFHGWGPHAGFSFTPDQFFFGAHFDLGDFAPNFQFQPSIDLGLGDDLTFFSASPDIVYNIPAGETGAVYFGGIFAFQYIKVDNVPAGFDDSDTNVGVHILGGLKLKSQPIHFQAEVGVNDNAPDWRFSGGYTFQH